MRLVLQCQQTDGCTFHCTDTFPVEYESAEALLVDLMEEAEKALREQRPMQFLGAELSTESFFERAREDGVRRELYPRLVRAYGIQWFPVPPTILTLDEWFASSEALCAKA